MSIHKKNIIKFILEIITIIILLVIMFILIKSNFKYSPIINSVCSCLVGVLIKIGISTALDIYDSLPWQTYLRALIRAKEISANTYIRISYAYLFRIEIDGKYFLIRNKNGINKYQPPGHTYTLSIEEKNFLKQKFSVLEDDKLTTKKIKNDYRLRVKAKYLKSFFNRFCHKIDNEHTENYVFGFKQTLLDSNILDCEIFKNITYRIVRRDIQKISFSKFFQCYEMLLADIIEITLDTKQAQYLRGLIQKKSNEYIFATDKYIRSLGVDPEKNDFVAEISEHTEKILPD